MTEVHFIIPGEPVAKARPRVTSRMTYTPQKTKDYEELVRWMYKQQCKNKKLEGPLRLAIDIYMYIPKSVSKKRRKLKEDKKILPTKKPDWDNVSKSITDALNKVAYEDDSKIVDIRVRKYFSEDMRAEVTISEMEDLNKEDVDEN